MVEGRRVAAQHRAVCREQTLAALGFAGDMLL
jgi:hypothetical protein